MYGGSIGTLKVYIQYDGDSTLTGPLTFNANGSNVTQLSGAQTSTTVWYTAKITNLAGYGKIYWQYVSGTYFTGDAAIDDIRVMDAGTSTQRSEVSTSSLETTTNNTTSPQTPSSTTYYSISTSSTAARWNIDSSGTPSGNTGPSNDSSGDSNSTYVYAEVSNAGYPSKYMTLRMTNSTSTY